MLGIFRRRPSPAMVVALIALFAALTGTAAALHGRNSVASNDIKNGQVKTPDLAKKAVTPSRAHLTKEAQNGGAIATSSTSPVALSGGPSVTVSVPPGALVAVFAQAQLEVTGSNHARIGLFEPVLLPGAPTILQSNSNTLETKRTAPGFADGDGVTGTTRAGWIVLAPAPGTYHFSLHYSADGGTATFASRKLYVTVLG
jgi:hypothetical protein